MAPISPRTRSRIANRLITASVWLFFLSLALPAYVPQIGAQSPERMFGIFAFFVGPIGLFAGHFSWLANPLLWFAWGRFNKSKELVALGTAIAALMVALGFALTKTVAVGSSGEYPYTLSVGYFVWLASIVSTIAATLIGRADVPAESVIPNAS
jgi:hypothetical protein